MSWGYRVIIIISVFVIGILSMVFISMKQTNEVIDSNYYEKEMRYQEVIDGKQNLQNLNDSIRVIADTDSVHLIFPELTVSKLDSGKIEFLKLSNSKLDQTVLMKSENGNNYSLPAKSFSKGVYRLRVDWKNDGKGYYQEQDVWIK